MKHITINNLKQNTLIRVKATCNKEVTSLRLSCSSLYTLYIDNKVYDFGPERTGEGYTRIREIKIPHKFKTLEIEIIYYGVPTFDVDLQTFFFGFELLNNKQIIQSVDDVSFYKDCSYLQDSCKYSFQRGFVERHDFTNEKLELLDVTPINSPIELDSNPTNCSFNIEKSSLLKEGVFNGFKQIADRGYLKRMPQYDKYDIDEAFFTTTKQGYKYRLFSLSGNKTGLISLNIKSNLENSKAYICYDEILVDDDLLYGRGTVTNMIELNLIKGEYVFNSANVYTAKYIMVIYKDGVDIIPSMILVENDSAKEIGNFANKDIKLVMEASRNSFMQNAYDIFTDCPSRERAGWLCDSYFIGMGEHYFTNDNKIEKHFIENFILSKCPEINNDDIVPMCFPSSHVDGNYIPNWAMWFVLELERYYKDTNDKETILKAKDRVYGILKFFNKYENEIGLLENLPAWVFIEWSLAGSPEYVKGINFPTNMTYVGVLETVANLYDDKLLLTKAKNIKEQINKLSFDGNYYHDNALRGLNNEIKVIKDHTSETAQYYALFFNINNEDKFVRSMIENFSSDKEINENGMPKSNVFIGNFLRYLILLRNKEYKRLLNEAIPYFAKMANQTNTLWEKDTNNASCNHGLTAALAPIIDECLNNI